MYNEGMYFESRAEAGVKLADQLMDRYRYENVAVVSLSQSGVAVGYQVAINLHAPLRRLLMEPVRIEDESIDYATVMPGGVVAINSDLTEGQQQYYYSEYAGWLEGELRQATAKLNRQIDLNEVSPDNLRGYNVIFVDDGIDSSIKLSAAMTWLKPARVERVILACPVISVEALDKAHILFDELHILGVAHHYLDTNHYYDTDDAPDDEMARRMMRAAIGDWK